MEAKKYDLNDLYKVLKQHDIDILKHFCDSNLSNDDYFFYGINSDIISNSLNIVVNMLSGNIESAGVDLSCRSIIEAFVILRMDSEGVISEKQKEIFRYLYAYVDVDNFHSILKDIGDTGDDYFKKIAKDKEKAKQAIIEHFGCKAQDLKNKKISIDDPCFYLKTKLNENIKFSKLLEKHHIGNEEVIKMYEFFSLFIHPRCEMNPEIEQAIMSVRKIYIDYILDYVFNYLKECNLLNINNDIDFNDEFFNNPLLTNNVHNIKEFEKSIYIMKEMFCKLPNGYDWFTWHFLEKTRYLLIDMMISLSLGYKEHVISIFKSFVEEYSVFFAVGSVESQKDFDYIKQAFWCSSRIQIDAHFESLGLEGGTTPEDSIFDLYNNYFKEKYQLNDYEEFKSELKRNSLYFLGKERKSYNKFVRNLIEEVFTDVMVSKDVMTMYRIAKDMSHASGYNFNASEGIIDVFSQKSILYAWQLILHFVINVSLTLHEHGVKNDVKPIVDWIGAMMSIHTDAIEKTQKEFINKSNNADIK